MFDTKKDDYNLTKVGGKYMKQDYGLFESTLSKPGSLLDYLPTNNFLSSVQTGSPLSFNPSVDWETINRTFDLIKHSESCGHRKVILCEISQLSHYKSKLELLNQELQENISIVAVDLINVDIVDVFNFERKDLPTSFFVGQLLNQVVDPRRLFCLLRELEREIFQCNFHFDVPSHTSSSLFPQLRRNWDSESFDEMLSVFGFKKNFRIEQFRKNDEEKVQNDYSCYYEFSIDNYTSNLSKVGINPSIEIIVVTSEHAGMEGRTGGIGNYVCELELLFPKQLICLIASEPAKFSHEYIRSSTSNFPIFVGNIISEAADVFEQTQFAIEHLALLLDKLRIVEIQDYNGIGYRVAQSRRSGLLKSGISVLTRMHGIQRYVDKASNFNLEIRDVATDLRERIQLENSDSCVFPSDYLLNFCISELHYEIPDAKVLRLPYFDAHRLSEIEQRPLIQPKRFVFFGKPNLMKGFDLFCEAINLTAHQIASSKGLISPEVLLLGVSEQHTNLNSQVIRKITFSGNLTREEVEKAIISLRADSVFVLPYRGDNAPLSVDLVGLLGGRIVCLDAGGVPEQFTKDLGAHCLSGANAVDLAKKLLSTYLESDTNRNKISRQTQETFIAAKEMANRANEEFYAKYSDNQVSQIFKKQDGQVTAVLTNFEGEEGHLRDSIISLKNSYMKPSKILIADDSSSGEHVTKLHLIAEELLSEFSWEIISQQENSGLPALRNLATKHVNTEYVVFLDNDDVLADDFIFRAKKILDSQPDISAVTAFSSYFNDGEDWKLLLPYAPGYRPIGQDIALGIPRNVFGHSSAMFRVSKIRELNGWNANTRAMWEDWELFLSFTIEGNKICLIPIPSLLYRVRTNSMARTYSISEGMERIRNLLPFPNKYKDLLLVSLTHASISSEGMGSNQFQLFSPGPKPIEITTQDTIERLNKTNEELNWALTQIYASNSWKITKPLRILTQKIKRLNS